MYLLKLINKKIINDHQTHVINVYKIIILEIITLNDSRIRSWKTS